MATQSNRRRKEPGAFQQHAPVAAALEDCLQTCDLLSSVMDANRQIWDEKVDFLENSQRSLIEWANVHHAADGLLDHTLRKSSALRVKVVEILESLDRQLQSVLEDVRMTAIPLLSPALLEEIWLSYFERQTISKESFKPPVSEKSLQDKIDLIPSILERLHRLTTTLENPFPSDLFSTDLLIGDDTFDIQMVSRLFPYASSTLKQRLAHANWLRKSFLRSLRAEKHLEGRRELDLSTSRSAAIRPLVSIPDSPTRRMVSRPLPNFVFEDPRAALSRLGSTAPSDTASNSGTVFSKPDSGYVTNTAPSVNDFDESLKPTAIPIPLPPVPLKKGETFTCPYCALPITVGGTRTLVDPGPGQRTPTSGQQPRILPASQATVMDVSSSADWAAHVFGDLEPYMCTFEDCYQHTKTYSVREDWVYHELYTHHIPRVWSCESCLQEWATETEFHDHLTSEHQIPADQVHTLAQSCVKHTEKVPSQVQCSLCRFDCSFESYWNHVGDHLEQLALTAVEIEGPESPRSTSVSLYEGDKFTLLQDFIQEQSERTNLEQDRLNNPFFQPLPTLWTDNSHVSPKGGSPTQARPSRPRLSSRGPSYTYMQRVRELKVEEAMRSNATTPLAQWKSVEPTTSAQSAHSAICTLQPPRNPDFVGRINDLGAIHEKLEQEGNICVIRGIGGLGKSALATAYTWKFKSCYSYIFWVPAETAMVCTDSFSQIALKAVPEAEEVVEEERLINMGREFLEQTTDRWLLIFDNVEEGFDLRRFLPSSLSQTHGSILITTQKRDLDVFHLSEKTSFLDLNVLNLEESRELLLRSTNRGDPIEDLRSHPEYKLAGEIAKRAEKLPLALSLIAGFVMASECTLAYFVELWNERQMWRTTQDVSSEADSAMEMVWNIGLREVKTDARQLLNILAFFDSDNIQKSLLVGPHEDPLLEMLHSHSPMRWNRMTSELSKRRLITVRNREGEEVLSIHRKLQAKILDELNQSDNGPERTRVFEKVFLLIRSRFPRPSPIQVPEPEKWPICRQYLPHVLSIKRLWQSGLVEIPPSVKLARLISDAGIDLWERCLTTEGLELLRSAESILNQAGFQEDLLRANIHVVVSLLLQDSGISHLAECRDRISKVIDIRVKYRETCDPALYTRSDEILLYNAWSDFGCVLLQYNNFKEAGPIFDKCLEKYRQWGTPEEIPYEYAKYHHHKAYCLMYERDFDKAVPLAEHGLYWVEVATGKTSAASNRWRFDFACVVLQSGDKKRALELHKKVLEARMKLHGKFGLLTLQSYYAVGAAHAWLGETAEAEKYMTKILEIDKTRPGICPEPALAQAQFHLSLLLTMRAEAAAKTDSADDAQHRSDLEEEAASLAQMARKSLLKPHSLGPLMATRSTDLRTGRQSPHQSGTVTPTQKSSRSDMASIPKEHELALFDHLQPLYDGRFTGLHLLQYLR